MAIFRGVGGSGDSSDNSFLQEVTAQANSASASASAAQASATSAANSLAAIQDTEITSASFDTSDGVLTLTKTGGATVTADLDGRFLTSYTETDPVFSAHVSSGITSTQISNWDTAYGWGNHASAGYLTSETSHADVLQDGDFASEGLMKRDATSGSYSIVTDNSSNWDTAHGWGNHASAGYLTTHQDITGKADLSGAGFTGNVSTSASFIASDYMASIGALGSAPVAHVTASTASSPANNSLLELGGSSYWANKFNKIALNAGAGGVEMHWYQNTDNISGQTLRFHTTDRGIHVGDDRTGTYTAGDNQSNADIDFGMLVGRESANLGSNNFGFGYDIDFSVDTASNLGAGSLIDVYEDTVNSVAFGGAVRLGKSVSGVESGVTASFVGGNIARTQGDYSFTWGKGELDENGIYPTVNEGYGCALFGHITEIDSDSNWCLAGGNFTSIRNTSIADSDSSIAWGSGVSCSDSNNSAVFGHNNFVYTADECLVSGKANSVYLDRCVVGGASNTVGLNGSDATEGYNSACFGSSNLVEGNSNFISGSDNNSLGDSGACIGRGLKTPLFQPVGGGSYVWDDYSVVVGGYNAEATKYYTNTNNTAWVEDHRFVVGTGTSSTAKRNGFIVAVPTGTPTAPDFCGIIMPALASSTSYANASAAKAGGVPVGGLYRIGSDVKILLSTD